MKNSFFSLSVFNICPSSWFGIARVHFPNDSTMAGKSRNPSIKIKYNAAILQVAITTMLGNTFANNAIIFVHKQYKTGMKNICKYATLLYALGFSISSPQRPAPSRWCLGTRGPQSHSHAAINQRLVHLSRSAWTAERICNCPHGFISRKIGVTTYEYFQKS